MRLSIEVVSIEDQEDGDSIITFDMDYESIKAMATIGMKFVLYCEATNKSTSEVLNDLIKGLKDE